MREKINRFVIKFIQSLGYTLSKSDPVMEGDEVFNRIYAECEKYTMTSRVKMYELYKSVEYIVRSNIQGDFVECGVWKGGSVMLMALTLRELGETHRDIYLYDTFEGMSAPTKEDHLLSDSTAHANSLMEKRPIYKCISPLEEVEKNMASTHYPMERLHFVKGKVEDSIPGTMPNEIALLRLDTDWYESTIHELHHLYPLLVKQGVLILDDFGYWAGQKTAVDEYFENISILLTGTSDGGRIGVKTV